MSVRRSGHAKLLARAGAGASCPPQLSLQPCVGPRGPVPAVSHQGQEWRGAVGREQEWCLAMVRLEQPHSTCIS